MSFDMDTDPTLLLTWIQIQENDTDPADQIRNTCSDQKIGSGAALKLAAPCGSGSTAMLLIKSLKILNNLS